MGLPTYGTQNSIQTITKDTSMSPQVENGIHRTIFNNIENTKEMLNQRHLTIDESNPYAKFHRHLKSFHAPGIANQRNGGFNIQAINEQTFKLDPGLTGLDFGSISFASKQAYQYERQKYCVYLMSGRNGVPLNFKLFAKDMTYFAPAGFGMNQGTIKMFLKGFLSAPEQQTFTQIAYDSTYLLNNPTHIDDAVPMVGFILDHNLSKTSPQYYVIGWNRYMELIVSKFTLDNGFQKLKQFFLNENLLYCNWGRIDSISPNSEHLVLYRKPRRALHYGFNNPATYGVLNQQRDNMTSYHWAEGDSSSWNDNDCLKEDVSSMVESIDDALNIGLFFSPNSGFEIHGLQYGYDFEGF